MVYAGTGAAAAAAMANAIKASGAIVQVSPEEFMKLLDKVPEPLVVAKEGERRWWEGGKPCKYLLAHRGFVFYTQSDTPLSFPSKVDIISAQQIWIPA